MTRRRARHNGEGSLTKRQDGRWEGKYTAGVTPDGKQVRRSVYGRTRAEAAEKLKAKLAETPKGAIVLTERGKLTLADQLRAHLSLREAELGPGTVLKLESYIKVVSAHSAGGVALVDLKPAHLETLYRDLSKKYAAATVRHISVFVKQGLRRAVRHELLRTNVAEVAELPRMRDEKAAHPLEPEQLAAAMEQAQKVRLYPLFATIATLGLRHGEALGLQWGDIDWKAGTLEVQRTVVSRSGTPTLSTPKTRASLRTLYLPDELRGVLLVHLDALRTEGLSVSPTAWVFPSTVGGMLSQHNVRRVWRQILTAAKLPTETRIHDLRHTFVSRLIEAGADPRTAADLAGHSDPRMTLSVYTHSRAEQRKAALLASAGRVLPGRQPVVHSKARVPKEEEETASGTGLG
ncbi:tyrosine-type recombinase/integrase [Deinococcus hopiensis]|uniref:Site-specific recombinase XerD n=1 Tax=Deinococcus hopiensis KR-140 TaxID=695939 RepID=A0A1W1VK08_9DEIO|nr:site-specific integrase [Deinococcus hopiensis]SMB93401.1 Site-specific recombinase XerD [Deinococcus hopiensis KR-140]